MNVKDFINPEAAADIRIKLFEEQIKILVDRLLKEEISLEEFELQMRSELRGAHVSNLAVGLGKWSNVPPRLWGRVGYDLRVQYEYLNNFTQVLSELQAEDAIPSYNALVSRAVLYARSAKAQFYRGQLGEHLGMLLPAIPRDGTSKCKTNCTCTWRIELVDEMGYDAYWEFGANGPDCPTCKWRNERWYPLKVRGDELINYNGELGPI